MRQGKVELLQGGGIQWRMYGCSCVVEPVGNGWRWHSHTWRGHVTCSDRGTSPDFAGARNAANAAAIRLGRAPNMVT